MLTNYIDLYREKNEHFEKLEKKFPLQKQEDQRVTDAFLWHQRFP
jgi:hypothetical protein